MSDTSKPEPERGLPNPIERALGLAGLVAVAPVLGAAAVAIRATSPGPAIFRQQRVGRHGRPFTLYKLRTMRSDVSGPQFTADGDARITPVGRVLRKTKIDELPELWNVVRGDLSLVGPRPEVSRYIDLSDPRWRRALEARPGLTHPVTLKLRNEEELLSAVQGSSEAYYERTLVPYKLKGYLDYQSQRSWRSDLKIIGQTALVIAFPRLAPPPSQAEVEAEAAALAPA